jgi:hypothetical protein
MGFVSHGSGAASYLNKHNFPVFHAVHDDLVLGEHDCPRRVAEGSKIAELAVMWRPEQDHESTEREQLLVLDTGGDVFAARVGEWLAACNFGGVAVEIATNELPGGAVLEPMEPRLIRAVS